MHINCSIQTLEAFSVRMGYLLVALAVVLVPVFALDQCSDSSISNPAAYVQLTIQLNQLSNRIDQIASRFDQFTSRVDQNSDQADQISDLVSDHLNPTTIQVNQLVKQFDQISEEVDQVTNKFDRICEQVDRSSDRGNQTTIRVDQLAKEHKQFSDQFYKEFDLLKVKVDQLQKNVVRILRDNVQSRVAANKLPHSLVINETTSFLSWPKKMEVRISLPVEMMSRLHLPVWTTLILFLQAQQWWTMEMVAIKCP